MDKHFVNAAEGERHWKVSAVEDDERFIKLETLAGARAKPKPLAEKTIVAEKQKSARCGRRWQRKLKTLRRRLARGAVMPRTTNVKMSRTSMLTTSMMAVLPMMPWRIRCES